MDEMVAAAVEEGEMATTEAVEQRGKRGRKMGRRRQWRWICSSGGDGCAVEAEEERRVRIGDWVVTSSE